MAQGRGSGGRARGRAPKPSGRTPKRATSPLRSVSTDPAPAPLAPGVLRLGAVPGATPGRWIDRWNERMPHIALELVPLDADDARRALDERRVDAAIVRRPIDEAGLHVIPLYDEVPVVVVSADSELTVVDELTADDLAGSVLLVPRDDVLGSLDLPGTVAPSFEPLETTADAIATAATGVGVVVVPMSLARLHHRRDVTYRPLAGGPLSPVAFAWLRDRDGDDVQALVGIIRGRTANSSR
ncbi:substrate-binding domain-containing protein [Microbacterium sp. NPDC055683]